MSASISATAIFRDISVIDLIIEKMPVSISLGLWITLISYMISIPLGIRKAVKDGTPFDVWTSAIVIIGYAIPGFLFGILLMVLFAGGSFFDWFPLRGLVSDNFDQLVLVRRRSLDYFWHLALPLTAMVLSAFATDDAADEELLPRRDQQAVCRHGPRQGPVGAAGALRPRLPQRHADRHRRLSRRLHLRLLHRLAARSRTSSRSTGLGLLGYDARCVDRDYPVVFATLYIFSLIGLVRRR